MKNALSMTVLSLSLLSSISAHASGAKVVYEVLKEAVHELPKELPTVAGKTTKTMAKVFAPYDLVKAPVKSVIVKDKSKQAVLVLDVIKGNKKSLKSMSEDSRSLLSSINLSKEDLKRYESYAFLGKNSKGQGVFINVRPLKNVSNIKIDPSLDFSIIRELTAEESKLVDLKDDKIFRKINLELYDGLGEKLIAAFKSQGQYFIKTLELNGISHSAIETASGNKKVMTTFYSIDTSRLDKELLAQILTEITK